MVESGMESVLVATPGSVHRLRLRRMLRLGLDGAKLGSGLGLGLGLDGDKLGSAVVLHVLFCEIRIVFMFF